MAPTDDLNLEPTPLQPVGFIKLVRGYQKASPEMITLFINNIEITSFYEKCPFADNLELALGRPLQEFIEEKVG